MKTNTISPLLHFAEKLKIKQNDLYLSLGNTSYNLIQIPKKNGSLRDVYAPCPTLKKVQRQLAIWFNDIYKQYTPKNVMGFVKSHGIGKRRDIVSNAKKHIHNAYMVNIDIKDFFQSCTPQMLFNVLLQLEPLSKDIIDLIYKLCFLNDSLPPGSPTSPVLSNIVMIPIDKRVNGYCKANEITYSRYVDDLSFSSNKKITKQNMKAIAAIIAEYGFQINEEKTNYFKKSDIKEVTGIAIENNKLKLCKGTIEEIEENISYYHIWKQKILKQYGAIPEVRQKISNMQRSIKGQLNFAKRIDGRSGKTYEALKARYESSIDEKDFNFKLYI